MCEVEGCSNMSIQGGVCVRHGRFHGSMILHCVYFIRQNIHVNCGTNVLTCLIMKKVLPRENVVWMDVSTARSRAGSASATGRREQENGASLQRRTVGNLLAIR